MPQVPPLGIGSEGEGSILLFEVELLKIENFFLTCADPH
jgi:hypothetical protein